MGIDVRDPDQPVGTLSGGERQAVAIARAVYFGARVLILDEPTSALGVKQSGIVLRYVVQARERGVGVIFITHNPHHAYPVGDRFVLLNRGRLLGSWKGEISRDGLVKMMAGGAELDQLDARARRCWTRSAEDDGGGTRPAGDDGPARGGDRRRRDRLRLDGAGAQPLHAAAADAVPRARGDPGLVALRRHRPAARWRRPCGRSASREAHEDWRRVVGGPGRSTRSSSPRRTCCTSSSSRRPPRPASTSSARSPSAARPRRPRAPSGRPALRRDHRRGLQLPLRAARAVRAPPDRRGPPGQHHQLPRPLLLDLRRRPARRALLALPREEAGYGVTTDLLSHAVDLAHILLGPIERVVGTIETFIRERPLPVSARRQPLRARRGRRPDRRGHQRGLRRDAVRVRERRARHLRVEPHAGRAGEPDGLRRSTAPRARWAGTSSA